MSWAQRQEQQRNVVVTAQILEERISMYISAMDSATAMNNGHQSTQLQQDIQTLVDLMEKISSGQTVREQEVPPPLVIGSQVDILANPLGELSSCLAEYHKALYFAEEEQSEDRLSKIQRLQKGLQAIHELQKRAQAGFPVRADEIPPRVTIPSDNEFDADAINTLTSRIESYKTALSAASQSESDKKRISKLQSAMRSAEFLLTRAKAKRPVWKKDIPPEYDYHVLDTAQKKSQPINKAKFILQLRSLQKRVEDIFFKDKKQQKLVDELKKKLQSLEEEISGKASVSEVTRNLTILTQEIEKIESIAFAEKTKGISNNQENLNLIEIRINEYKAAALSCKRDGQVNNAIKHFKVIKGLLPLKEALEKDEPVDMTLVPPPPPQFTPTNEMMPPFKESIQNTVTTERSSDPVGANAQLVPVVIKPAVESNEDKLAKKLFSFLDKGTDMNLSTSKQMQNIHNINMSAARSHPKVQNTEVRRESKHSASLDSPVSSTAEINGFNKSNINTENHVNGVSSSSMLENKEKKFPAKEDDRIVQDISNGISEITLSPNDKCIENIKNDEQSSNHANETTTFASILNSSPSKSSDIYSRKTLDTVGFLSCQVVPDHSLLKKGVVSNVSTSIPKVTVTSNESTSKPKEAIVSSDSTSIPKVAVNFNESVSTSIVNSVTHNSMAVNDNYHLPDSDTVKPQGFDVNATNNDLVDLSSDFNSSFLQDPHSTTANTVTDNTQNEALTMVQSNNTEFLHSVQNNSHDNSNSGPSSLPIVNHISVISSADLAQEPSSLPIDLMPKVYETNIHNNKHMEHSITPDTSGLPDSVGIINSVPINSTRDFVTELINKTGLENKDDVSSKDFNNIMNLSSNTGISTHEGSNGLVSPEEDEFQDLIDSMAMPLTAPLSAFVNISVIKKSSIHNGLSEPSSARQDCDGVSQENYSGVSATSGMSRHAVLFQVNGPSDTSSLLSSNTQQFIGEVSNGTTNTITNSYLSNDGSLGITHATSSSYETGLTNHLKQTSDNSTSTLESRVLDQKSLNGSLSNKKASNSLIPSSQDKNMPQTSLSQPSKILSKSLTASRSANVFAYNDVAFTCLENLKYDCLLNLAKDTDESKDEEKKLRAKFELIKSKLQNGGKRTWEVYKACVQREHTSIVQQIEDLCLLQQWGEVQILSEKKCIAERELNILNDRLPELKY